MVTCKLQDRPVEAKVVSPVLVVAAALQQTLLIDLSGDVVVQMPLIGSLKKLGSNGEINPLLMQTLDDRQLVEMAVEACVSLRKGMSSFLGLDTVVAGELDQLRRAQG